MDVKAFKQQPIMGILRGITLEAVEPLVKTVVEAGLKTIEITMNTDKAAMLIRQMVKFSKGKLNVGAGTVLNLEDLKEALAAGATFIVLPTLKTDVVGYCVERKIPVFPGALTPQEIENAWNAGATMVKVFPAKFFGPEYFKEIKGPFSNIELLACGGVNPGNVQSFLDSGASAVAFGGSVFKEEWLKEKNFLKIGESVKKLINSINT